jgi:hypothetical protein
VEEQVDGENASSVAANKQQIRRQIHKQESNTLIDRSVLKKQPTMDEATDRKLKLRRLRRERRKHTNQAFDPTMLFDIWEGFTKPLEQQGTRTFTHVFTNTF